MPLDPKQPWYMTPPRQGDREQLLRYQRALRLSTMQRENEVFQANADHDLTRRRNDMIKYRKYCIEHWQEYLDGKVAPYTGRRPKD